MPTANKKSSQQITFETKNGPFTLTYNLSRSSRARYMRINFDYFTHQLNLTLPTRATLADAQSFLRENQNWIAKKLKRKRQTDNLLEHLKKNKYLSLNGKHCALTIDYQATHPQMLWNDEADTAKALLHPDVCPNRQLAELLYNLAKKTLVLRTHDLITRLGILMPHVTVRNQRTLWGSCSNRGTLSLNWRLILVKPHLQDHVIYHELTHLAEMNHSKDFWDLLRSYSPYTEVHEKELNDLSPTIMPLGHDTH